MKFRLLFGVLMSLSVCAAAPLSVRAALPGANDAKVYTNASYARDVLVFNKDTLSGAYVRVGKMDPRWDDAAVEFLDGMAARFSYAGTSVLSRPPGGKSGEELLGMGKAVIEDGCDDPLVMYCYATLLSESGDTRGAQGVLQTAAEGMMKSKYPVFRKLRAVDRWLDSISNQADRPAEAKAFCAEALAQLATSPECAGVGRRVLLGVWDDVAVNVDTETKSEIVQAMLNDAKSEPWFSHAAAGNFYIEAAWKARGGGWADTVTDKGWKGFHEALADAHEHLLAAYKAEPTYPEAPTRMITVAMGDGESLKITPREWFDKAVAAQIDYKNAYTGLLGAILPRWGGSHKEMLTLAAECAEAKRYDTDLPFMFEQALDTIANDDGASVIITPEFYAIAGPVFEEMAKRVGDREAARYHLSYKLAFEATLRNYTAARKTLEQMDWKPTEGRPLSQFGLTSARVVGKIHAMTGPQGKQLAAIESGLVDDRPLKTIDRLREIDAELTKTDPDGAGTAYVRNWIAAIEFKDAYAKGEWLDVTPTKAWTGWTKVSGEWTVRDDGSVTAVALAEPAGNGPGEWFTGPTLTFDRALGKRFALKANISGDAWWGGILVAGVPPKKHTGAWFGQRGQTVDVGDVWKNDKLPITVGVRHELLLEVWDGMMTVTIDGKKVGEPHAIDVDSTQRISLNGLRARKGRAIVYENVQVKVLTVEP